MRKNDTLYIRGQAGRRITPEYADEPGQGKSANPVPAQRDPNEPGGKTPSNTNLTATHREELRLKAKLLEKLAAQSEDSSTERLEDQPPDVMKIVASVASPGFKSGEAESYIQLPARRITDLMGSAPLWRIELHGLGKGISPIGIDIAGDVVIGRGPDADLDLDRYGGYERGVSRRHAMLRPSKRQLHLIDLGSTNGTSYNAVPFARCTTHSLGHNDVVTFGTLTVTIKIIDGPATRASYS